MEKSKDKLPCVPNMRRLWLKCTVLSVKSNYLINGIKKSNYDIEDDKIQ